MTLRHAVRALILDPDDHVLLVRFCWEGVQPSSGFWANPGGGVEPAETPLDAIRRELQEEIGLKVDCLGPEVWTKTAAFPIGHWDGQVDHIYLYRTERFDPAPALSPDRLLAENIHEIRWWSPEALSDPGVAFAPRSFPTLFDQLRRKGIPAHPIQLTGF